MQLDAAEFEPGWALRAQRLEQLLEPGEQGVAAAELVSIRFATVCQKRRTRRGLPAKREP